MCRHKSRRRRGQRDKRAHHRNFAYVVVLIIRRSPSLCEPQLLTTGVRLSRPLTNNNKSVSLSGWRSQHQATSRTISNPPMSWRVGRGSHRLTPTPAAVLPRARVLQRCVLFIQVSRTQRNRYLGPGYWWRVFLLTVSSTNYVTLQTCTHDDHLPR